MTDPERTSVGSDAAANPTAASTPPDTAPADTAFAPSLPPMQFESAPDRWQCGQQVGDFLLVKPLGKGSFGTVYLARQVSLERDVALKVTTTRAASHGEGLALAGLEHDHIVKVFAEFTDPKSGRYCLVLQYVPGADLSAVIAGLHEDGKTPNTGETVLKAIDRHVRGESRFDPHALRDREELARDDFAQAVCRFGSQLAAALAFAHARGVLHCDVKPANVLVTPYGRPMLADFNVSFDRARRKPDDTGIGGTLAYMAPEHKAAMLGQDDAVVDERSDVYSLGVVLHEIVTGRLPRPSEPERLDRVPRELAAVIRRCLDYDPTKRYQTATELADALCCAWALLGIRRSLPAAGSIGRWTIRRPATALTVFAFLPHVFGSVLNIGYNTVEINSQLTRAQESTFDQITMVFNFLVYPGVVAVWVCLLSRVRHGFAALPRADGAAVDQLRHHTLTLGYWVIGMAAVGWLPGGLLFPFLIESLGSDIVPLNVYVHYAVSFTLSGLVGIVFSYLGVQFAVLRALYPHLGNPDRFSPSITREELRGPAGLFVPCLTLASVVPLAGAVLLIVFAPETMPLQFRLLVVGLIGIGMAGVSLAARVTSSLTRLVAVWNTTTREERIVTRSVA